MKPAGQSPARTDRVLSTGIPALDGLLPDQGLVPGTLVEWMGAGSGSGAGTLAFTVAARLLRGSGACIVIDPDRSFYPPAVLPLPGQSQASLLQRMVVVHPATERDALWSLEQSLRCSGVAVVVCWINRLRSHACRRLQLAAEAGGGIGMLLRPDECRAHPSWADVRLRVGPLACVSPAAADRVFSGRRLRLELLHCRGRANSGALELELDDATGDVRLAVRVAAAAGSYHAAGA